MKRSIVGLVFILLLALFLSPAARAQDGDPTPDRFQNRELPGSLAELKLDTPLEMSSLPLSVLDPSLYSAEGSGKVIVRLTVDSIAVAETKGSHLARARRAVERQQDEVLQRVSALDPGAQEIARVQIVLNAVFLEVDASILPALANDPAVARIAPVGNYEVDLSETVPYIGASAVPNA